MIACVCAVYACVYWYQLKRSPTVGRGAREVADPMGSLEKSGRLARWDLSSSLTTVTRSNLLWCSWRKGVCGGAALKHFSQRVPVISSYSP